MAEETERKLLPSNWGESSDPDSGGNPTNPASGSLEGTTTTAAPAPTPATLFRSAKKPVPDDNISSKISEISFQLAAANTLTEQLRSELTRERSALTAALAERDFFRDKLLALQERLIGAPASPTAIDSSVLAVPHSSFSPVAKTASTFSDTILLRKGTVYQFPSAIVETQQKILEFSQWIMTQQVVSQEQRDNAIFAFAAKAFQQTNTSGPTNSRRYQEQPRLVEYDTETGIIKDLLSSTLDDLRIRFAEATKTGSLGEWKSLLLTHLLYGNPLFLAAALLRARDDAHLMTLHNVAFSLADTTPTHTGNWLNANAPAILDASYPLFPHTSDFGHINDAILQQRRSVSGAGRASSKLPLANVTAFSAAGPEFSKPTGHAVSSARPSRISGGGSLPVLQASDGSYCVDTSIIEEAFRGISDSQLADRNKLDAYVCAVEQLLQKANTTYARLPRSSPGWQWNQSRRTQGLPNPRPHSYKVSWFENKKPQQQRQEQ